MRRLRQSAMWCAAVVPALAGDAAGQRVIFVDQSAKGLNTGLSWADAYSDLQDALDDVRANASCPCEIWVAAGTYRPDRRSGDRMMAFEIPSDTTVIGGFRGGETRRDEAKPTEHETILSGDLDSDDVLPVAATSGCCQGSSGPGCDDAVCAAAVAEVTDEWIRIPCSQRWSDECAAYTPWVCCELCRPTRCDNSFNVVRIAYGEVKTELAGLEVLSGEGNGFDDLLTSAGAGLNAAADFVTVTDCTFRDNYAYGAAIYGWEASVSRCSFLNNSGGTIVSLYDISGNSTLIAVRECEFVGNRGCAVTVFGALATVEGCRFLANDASPASASGVYAGTSWSLITDSDFLFNEGSAVASRNSLTVRNSIFIGNHDGSFSGGINSDGATLTNCLFVGNRSGGAVYNGQVSPGFAGAFNGGLGLTRITNSTFVANSAGHVGGVWGGEGAEITNCILWANHDDLVGYGESAQYQAYIDAGNRITATIVQGWTGKLGGVGNSGDDPLFADPLGPDGVPGTEDDDLRLSAGSPAINAGAITASVPETDLDGHPRVLCGAVDIGAYEFGTADVYCDGAVGALEVETFVLCLTGPDLDYSPGTCLSFDVNTDSAIDLSDFAFLQRAFNSP